MKPNTRSNIENRKSIISLPDTLRGIGSISAFALFALTGMAHADSLFPTKKAAQAATGSSSSSSASLFTDSRAHSVGDVLTITIAENTTAQSSANTKTSKDETVSGFGGAGLFQRLFKELSFSANNSRSGNGSGQTTRSGSLVTTLSVTVKEILPNGTLKVEGSRLVGINKETQKVTFTGIARPEDISTDNTIPSNLIAGVEVRYDGKGVIGDTQKPGLFTRIFRFLF
jgi:flagellar L-ring protein precursor FlgH